MAEKKSKFAALADLHRAEPEILDEVATPSSPDTLAEREPAAVEPPQVKTPIAPAAIAPPPKPRTDRAPRVTTPVSVVDDYPRRGRPPTGKRSNPEWKLYSHYLKRQTQRAAVAKLQALDDGRDLSDVIEELLQTWNRK